MRTIKASWQTSALVALAFFGGLQATAVAWPPPPPLPGQGMPPSASVVEVGTRAMTGNDDSSKFREYREYEPQALFGNAFVHRDSSDGTRFFDLILVDPLEDDQRAAVTYGRYGEWEATALVDEVPHVFSLTARSLYTEANPGLLLLPDATQAAIQAGGSAALARALGAVTVVPLEFQQTNTVFSGRYKIDDHWSYTGGYTKMHKDGTRPFGMGFGSPGNNFVNVAGPIDQNIHDVQSGVSYLGSGWNLNLSYWGSFFRNDIDTLTVDNPLRVADSAAAGAKQGRTDLDPDNDSNNISLSGSKKLDLSWPARISGTISKGRRKQNDQFIPHTINSAINNAALNLPAASLDGRQDTTLVNLMVSGRPSKNVNLTGRFRYYDLDSKTRDLEFDGHVLNDRSLVLEERHTAFTEYTKENASVDAAWRLSRELTWRGGYEHESWDRPAHREVATTREDSWKTGLDWRPDLAQRWLLRSDYTYAARVGTEYNTLAHFHVVFEEDAFDTPIEQLSLQSPLLRKFDLANRRQHRGQLACQYTPRDDVTVGLTGTYGLADYDGSPLGLQADERFSIGTDSSWQMNDRTRWGSFYTYEKIRARQISRFRTRATVAGVVTLFDDPANDWNSTTVDRVNNFGGSLDYAIKPGTWDSTFTATRQIAHGQTLASPVPGTVVPVGAADGGNAEDFPEISDQLDTLSAILRRHLAHDRSLQFEYRYEHYSQENFKVDGLEPFMPLSNVNANGVVSASTDVFLGDQIGNFNVHVFALSALQRF